MSFSSFNDCVISKPPRHRAQLFFVPIGILLGPFLGAFLGELIAQKPVGAALKGGLGAFLGFLSGVFLKLLACVAMSVVFVLALR